VEAQAGLHDTEILEQAAQLPVHALNPISHVRHFFVSGQNLRTMPRRVVQLIAERLRDSEPHVIACLALTPAEHLAIPIRPGDGDKVADAHPCEGRQGKRPPKRRWRMVPDDRQLVGLPCPIADRSIGAPAELAGTNWRASRAPSVKPASGERLWENPDRQVRELDLLALPGGVAYGGQERGSQLRNSSVAQSCKCA